MNNSSLSENNTTPETADTMPNTVKEIQCAWDVEDLLFTMEDALYDTFSDRFDLFYLRDKMMEKLSK